jgi:formylglycine-generating enzyme required for sulfatase activity
MLAIPAGTFAMGSPSGELGRDSDETQRAVVLTRAFLMSRTEITQGDWQAVMNTDVSLLNAPNLPMVNVNWWDAVEYANRLSERSGLAPCYTLSGCTGTPGSSFRCTGIAVNAAEGNPLACAGYRLPTESEWEYAYRAGTTSAFYNGGITDTGCNDPNLDQIGWYCGNSTDQRQVVGQKLPNAYGLYDMAGNVWEWCWDWYGTYPGAVSDPLVPGTGSFRVARGGSFNYDASNARAATRLSLDPSERFGPLGFRLVRTAP